MQRTLAAFIVCFEAWNSVEHCLLLISLVSGGWPWKQCDVRFEYQSTMEGVRKPEQWGQEGRTERLKMVWWPVSVQWRRGKSQGIWSQRPGGEKYHKLRSLRDTVRYYSSISRCYFYYHPDSKVQWYCFAKLWTLFVRNKKIILFELRDFPMGRAKKVYIKNILHTIRVQIHFQCHKSS